MPEQQQGRMRGFQLWINLPGRDKLTAPKYQEYGPEKIPDATVDGGARVKVIAGRVGGVSGPVVQPATDPIYLDISLDAGAQFAQSLPAEHAAFLYVYEGAMRVGSGESAATVGAHELAVLGNGDLVQLEDRQDASGATGRAPSRAILLAGRPLREPVAKYGPFVMNTREELMKAFEDYQSGKF
jgi:redox-sensitive bicupin YhaK (pirin superfamily)